MGHGHAHDHGALDRVPVARRPRTILLTVLAVLAVATVAGLVVLWPSGASATRSGSASYAVKGTTFPTGEIVRIGEECPDAAGANTSAGDAASGVGGTASGARSAASACRLAEVRLESGPRKGKTVTVALRGPFASAGLRAGDTLELMDIPLDPSFSAPAGANGGADPGISVFGVVRTVPLMLWAALFLIVVVAVGLHRGLLAIVGLVFAGGMIVLFVLPALLGGGPATAIALVGASAILYVVLYLAHGVSVRTSAALAGTLGGVLITAVIALSAVSTTRLSGIDESAGFLSGMTSNLDFQGLLTCAIVIAGLGVLNDVTITQSSAVWELRAAAPAMSRRQLFRRAMRIGRDHIASTIYTIVFAYVGASLSVVLLLYVYDQPVISVLGYEEIATEIIRTLVSGIGLVLAVPLTTAIAVILLPAASSGPTTPEPLAERDAETIAWLKTMNGTA
ncbi:YibE/F family protein [uncultured Microbacterium sp.]|uniref:YibE/F family protein n=1 Tax=uncultured Microbacterium sp. TaxID=191216 RepID=UPI0025EA10AE|nr:YibE/F family protein [uncultured Microbacterium sp.]